MDPKIQFERDVEEINACPSQKPKPLVRPAAYSFYSHSYRVCFCNTKNKYILFVILKTEHLLIKDIKEFVVTKSLLQINESVIIKHYIISNDRVTDERKRIWEEAVVT